MFQCRNIKALSGLLPDDKIFLRPVKTPIFNTLTSWTVGEAARVKVMTGANADFSGFTPYALTYFFTGLSHEGFAGCHDTTEFLTSSKLRPQF